MKKKKNITIFLYSFKIMSSELNKKNLILDYIKRTGKINYTPSPLFQKKKVNLKKCLSSPPSQTMNFTRKSITTKI